MIKETDLINVIEALKREYKDRGLDFRISSDGTKYDLIIDKKVVPGILPTSSELPLEFIKLPNPQKNKMINCYTKTDLYYTLQNYISFALDYSFYQKHENEFKKELKPFIDYIKKEFFYIDEHKGYMVISDIRTIYHKKLNEIKKRDNKDTKRTKKIN